MLGQLTAVRWFGMLSNHSGHRCRLEAARAGDSIGHLVSALRRGVTGAVQGQRR